MRLRNIKAEQGKRLTLFIESDDGSSPVRYSVSDSLYCRLGSPAAGQEISDGALDEIINEDTRYRCMKRALSILSYADNNRLSLKRKLRHAGFCSSVADECIEECQRLGYIDERRQLCRLVKEEAETKLRGRRYITAKLSSKGYSIGLISSVIDELVESGDVDFERSLSRLLEKHGDGTEEMKKRLMYKYGYK